MKKIVLIVLTLSMLFAIALTGCSNSTPANASATPLPSANASKYPASAYSDANKISYGDLELEGAASVERDADIKDSPYFVHMDFYNMKSSDTLTILPQFKTIQQATEWTCGPTSALMVVDFFGKRGEMNEMDLVALRQKDEPGATNLRQMLNIFDGLGGWNVESTYDLEDPSELSETILQDYLKRGIPVIIGWVEWGGHWQVVIGYDTMGTETTADDVLIIADPYDTTDHDQDGYVIYSFERLYYNWVVNFDPDFDRNVFVAAWPSDQDL